MVRTIALFLSLLALIACGAAGASDPTQGIEGKWIWMEWHGNGFACRGYADVDSDGSIYFEELNNSNPDAGIINPQSFGVVNRWTRVSRQAVRFSDGTNFNVGYLTVDNKLMISMSLSPSDPTILIAVKDESGEDTFRKAMEVR